MSLCPMWSQWNRWTVCTATCGGRLRTRDRTCLNGEAGDQGCEGDLNAVETCNVKVCKRNRFLFKIRT